MLWVLPVLCAALLSSEVGGGFWISCVPAVSPAIKKEEGQDTLVMVFRTLFLKCIHFNKKKVSEFLLSLYFKYMKLLIKALLGLVCF